LRGGRSRRFEGEQQVGTALVSRRYVEARRGKPAFLLGLFIASLALGSLL
jgi:hypothetical protein